MSALKTTAKILSSVNSSGYTESLAIVGFIPYYTFIITCSRSCNTHSHINREALFFVWWGGSLFCGRIFCGSHLWEEKSVGEEKNVGWEEDPLLQFVPPTNEENHRLSSHKIGSHHFFPQMRKSCTDINRHFDSKVGSIYLQGARG